MYIWQNFRFYYSLFENHLDHKRYNQLTIAEIVVIISDTRKKDSNYRNIILQTRIDIFKRIFELHNNYISLRYSILQLYEKQKWYINMYNENNDEWYSNYHFTNWFQKSLIAIAKNWHNKIITFIYYIIKLKI